MTTTHIPTPKQSFFQSWYQRFMDWLWFGPLTRDLRPYRAWTVPPLSEPERRGER